MTSLASLQFVSAAPAQATAVVKKSPVATAAAWDPKLSDLRRQAEKAATELEEATKALKQRQSKIRTSQKQLEGKLRALEVAEQALAKVRQPLSEVVSLIYQQPSANDFAPFLSGDSTAEALRGMGLVTHLVGGRNEVIAESNRAYSAREKLAAEAQELRADNLLSEAQLAAEVDTLRKRSDRVVKSLTQALLKMGIKVDKLGKAAFSCDPTKAASANEFPNGLIPKAYLCPLQQPGHTLRADAAIAFISMNEAYKKQFGTQICVTDAYRDLAEQQSVYYRRPGFAAVPGRSNHGLGLALDLCGGVQNFRSPQFNWIEANGKKYGWFHPDWAYTNPFEPWHWEYDPKLTAAR
ncbi:D-alanyl-D-alanine carboxypeptidase family protein [Sinosporangium album]|nr:D-alanyl-D-alanine carboxypeptidase family protein [Sinosporangium album]